jgi:hypothetical protein
MVSADSLARLLLVVGGIYAILGTLFAAAFVARGIDRLDPGAHGARWRFRLLIAPASALLWPLLLRRWAAGRGAPPRERNAHDRAATASPLEDRA